LFVDRSCAGDEANLVYLPALPLDHRADGTAEGELELFVDTTSVLPHPATVALLKETSSEDSR
jgi:hypothetical protein